MKVTVTDDGEVLFSAEFNPAARITPEKFRAEIEPLIKQAQEKETAPKEVDRYMEIAEIGMNAYLGHSGSPRESMSRAFKVMLDYYQGAVPVEEKCVKCGTQFKPGESRIKGAHGFIPVCINNLRARVTDLERQVSLYKASVLPPVPEKYKVIGMSSFTGCSSSITLQFKAWVNTPSGKSELLRLLRDRGF